MLIPPDRHPYPRDIIMVSQARISAISSKKSFVDSGHAEVLRICTARMGLVLLFANEHEALKYILQLCSCTQRALRLFLWSIKIKYGVM